MDVRETTRKLSVFDSSAIKASVIPSAKYSSLESPLRFGKWKHRERVEPAMDFYRADRTAEPVTPSRNSRDVLTFAVCVQCPAKQKDHLIEVRLLDERLRPDYFHQYPFLDNFSRSLY
jgi:hypothetical protein